MEFDFCETKKENIINNLKSKLFDQIEDALFILIISVDQDCDMSFINDSACDMFEILSDKIFITTFLAVYQRIHEEDKIMVKQFVIESIKKEKKWNTSFKAYLPAKGLRYFGLSSKREVNTDGSVVLQGLIIDVSEIGTRELKLKFSEEHVKFALETSTIDLWDCDLEANTMYYLVQSLKALKRDLVNIINSIERWHEIIHTDDLEKYNLVLQDHLKHDTSFYEHFHRVLTSNNNYKCILIEVKL